MLPAGAVAIGVWLAGPPSRAVTGLLSGELVGTGLVLLASRLQRSSRRLRLPAGGGRASACLCHSPPSLPGTTSRSSGPISPPTHGSGADKTLVYAAGFALFAMWPWTPRAVTLMLALFTFGAAIFGVVTLVRLGLASDATGFFEEGRLRGADRLRERQRRILDVGRVAGPLPREQPRPPLARARLRARGRRTLRRSGAARTEPGLAVPHARGGRCGAPARASAAAPRPRRRARLRWPRSQSSARSSTCTTSSPARSSLTSRSGRNRGSSAEHARPFHGRRALVGWSTRG